MPRLNDESDYDTAVMELLRSYRNIPYYTDHIQWNKLFVLSDQQRSNVLRELKRFIKVGVYLSFKKWCYRMLTKLGFSSKVSVNVQR
ncbi:uncharacterized protein PHALS_14220 [Plasmopara halstedii]|uniref:Uncharacterized protein n=1 Tax=Plasmopara halstedii TaxID=4781 RepID=A0A0P1AR87_PLAHL|nr:uncharacterized protein PHALS_14220 [Plasmopara halstedii]CEG43941.1 hypothetical protein PHALS_14220 [Plasmopara halstedii]|eukprot:XP_024580310.1 hypothetical protein PHALS_14220 [Plasmopara halstedii]